MLYLDLTLPTPEENLALEEALLEFAEHHNRECLRLWESPTHFVVLGAGSPARTDVNSSACVLHGIPVLRRCSGGGTVLQGPGCLNYTLVLDRELRDADGLDSINGTNQLILTTIARALTGCGIPGAHVQGISDLTLGDLKFSGNAQRRRRRYVLFHGTLLYSMDLDLVSEVLGTPERMPDYRQQRNHSQFVRNIPLDPACARRAIADAWGASALLTPAETQWLNTRTSELATTRYRDKNWIWSI